MTTQNNKKTLMVEANDDLTGISLVETAMPPDEKTGKVLTLLVITKVSQKGRSSVYLTHAQMQSVVKGYIDSQKA